LEDDAAVREARIRLLDAAVGHLLHPNAHIELPSFADRATGASKLAELERGAQTAVVDPRM
jgi:hypothetical protein